jgi:lipid-A-disaccharide synthase-like uncharacterized protein
MTTTEALKILGFAALTLSVRILTWFGLAGSMGLFAYAVIFPDTLRIISAALFAVLVFIPSLIVEKKERRAQPIRQYQQQQQESEAA